MGDRLSRKRAERILVREGNGGPGPAASRDGDNELQAEIAESSWLTEWRSRSTSMVYPRSCSRCSYRRFPGTSLKRA